MLSLGKARHTLQRWLLGDEKRTPPTARPDLMKAEPPQSNQEDTSDQRISRFMEELKADSQEWLGRVRMIRFDSIRERAGPTWVKLEARIEILAEKIIQEELAGRDRYLKAGNAEFLVFFAEATPEESRIRCLAIVEAIHEKLFGSGESGKNSGRRVAECHLIHRDDLATVSPPDCIVPHLQSSVDALHQPFQRDAEILHGPDIAASTQIVIDSIISRAVKSRDMADLTPLLVRLQYLSRSLKTLEPVLFAASRAMSRHSDQSDITQAEFGEDGANKGNAQPPLGTAWEDIAELISALDIGPDKSHADLLVALAKLRRARQERGKGTLADEDALTVRFNSRNPRPAHFEYTPIYRSVSRGEHIHQGIYRVNRQLEKSAKCAHDDDAVSHPRQEEMISERACLEHAIQYLLDRRASARFMFLVSVHVETLRGPHSQMRYSRILRSAQLRAKRRLLIEVIGYRETDDTIGIRRAIEELRVHSHALYLAISPESVGSMEKIATECKRFGVHSFGIDVSQLNGRGAEITSTIARLASVGAQYSILTFVGGIDSVTTLAKAIALNVDYLCAPALRPPLPTPDDAHRATLKDLYWGI